MPLSRAELRELPSLRAHPPSPCDDPQVACSCLGETVQVCDGYSVDPLDSVGPCEGGVLLAPDAAAEDSEAPDSTVVGVADAGLNDANGASDSADAGVSSDATSALDASDATSEADAAKTVDAAGD